VDVGAVGVGQQAAHFRPVSIPNCRRQSGRSWRGLSSIHTSREDAVQYMRKAIVLFALSIAVCGCNNHDGQPRLESLERGLAEAWQPVALDMKLDIPDMFPDQGIDPYLLKHKLLWAFGGGCGFWQAIYIVEQNRLMVLKGRGYHATVLCNGPK
jgi:hypothetical protein